MLLTYLDGGGRSTPSLLDTVDVVDRHEMQGHISTRHLSESNTEERGAAIFR